MYVSMYVSIVTEMGDALGYVRLMRAGTPEPLKSHVLGPPY